MLTKILDLEEAQSYDKFTNEQFLEIKDNQE